MTEGYGQVPSEGELPSPKEPRFPVELPANEMPFWLETMRKYEARKIEAPYFWGGQEEAHAIYDSSPAPEILRRITALNNSLEMRSLGFLYSNPVLTGVIDLSETEFNFMLKVDEEINRRANEEPVPLRIRESLERGFENAIAKAGKKI